MSLSPRKLSETCRECKAPPLYACVHPVLGCSLASFHLQPTTVGEEIEPEARALSSGALRALHPVSAHQNDCSAAECGGEFTCEGCARVVGWCLGSGDLLGKEHCDDCWRDRLAVLQRVKDGLGTRFLLNSRIRLGAWRRIPTVVADQLCADGFLEFKRNGRFYLTGRGREVLS